jgi:hypothetical protein
MCFVRLGDVRFEHQFAGSGIAHVLINVALANRDMKSPCPNSSVPVTGRSTVFFRCTGPRGMGAGGGHPAAPERR